MKEQERVVLSFPVANIVDADALMTAWALLSMGFSEGMDVEPTHVHAFTKLIGMACDEWRASDPDLFVYMLTDVDYAPRDDCRYLGKRLGELSSAFLRLASLSEQEVDRVRERVAEGRKPNEEQPTT